MECCFKFWLFVDWMNESMNVWIYEWMININYLTDSTDGIMRCSPSDSSFVYVCFYECFNQLYYNYIYHSREWNYVIHTLMHRIAASFNPIKRSFKFGLRYFLCVSNYIYHSRAWTFQWLKPTLIFVIQVSAFRFICCICDLLNIKIYILSFMWMNFRY